MAAQQSTYKAVSGMLFLLLILSIGSSIYFYRQYAIINARVERFMPAAARADEELNMLNSTREELMQRIDELEQFKDSALFKSGGSAGKTVAAPQDSTIQFSIPKPNEVIINPLPPNTKPSGSDFGDRNGSGY